MIKIQLVKKSKSGEYGYVFLGTSGVGDNKSSIRKKPHFEPKITLKVIFASCCSLNTFLNSQHSGMPDPAQPASWSRTLRGVDLLLANR